MTLKIKVKGGQQLGPRQRAWVESLRKYPERQTDGILGRKLNGEDIPYKACCLGEAMCVKARIQKKRIPFNADGFLSNKDDINLEVLSRNDVKYFGFRTEYGDILDLNLSGSRTLATANDAGVTWAEIANFVELNPQAVFTKSL